MRGHFFGQAIYLSSRWKRRSSVPPPRSGACDMTIRDASGYRWYIVWLLLLVFILSYLDRYILTLLIEPIKASMGLNAFQVGLFTGPAFSLFHVLVGYPLGGLAVRSHP